MHVEKFKTQKDGLLSKIIMDHYSVLNYNFIQKLFRKKDVKVNNKRMTADCSVLCGDEIIFYIDDNVDLNNYDVFYEDDNVLLVNKKRGIEVESDHECDLIAQIKKDKKIDVYAVHRLDRNTQGLVLFAKNIDSKKELDIGFKNRLFEKYYIARVYGFFDKLEDSLVAYLKKDDKRSFVEISNSFKSGYEKIITNYKVLYQKDNYSIIEVELITGKTHQIRAHMASIGHFVLGDQKYGNSIINGKYGIKYQNLIAYKLILHFSKNSKLYYLNDKIFEIDKRKIDFLNKL